MANEQVPNNGIKKIEEAIKILWDDYRLRQEHYWKMLSQSSLAIITLWVIPYLKPEVLSMIGPFVYFFPFVAFILTLVVTWLLGAEYQRLAVIREEYDNLLEKRFGIKFVWPKTFRSQRIFGWRIGRTTTYIFLFGFTLISLLDLFVIYYTINHLKI